MTYKVKSNWDNLEGQVSSDYKKKENKICAISTPAVSRDSNNDS